MRRREFIPIIVGVMVAWPLPLSAQPAGRVLRVGILETIEPALNALVRCETHRNWRPATAVGLTPNECGSTQRATVPARTKCQQASAPLGAGSTGEPTRVQLAACPRRNKVHHGACVQDLHAFAE